ncbi:MAG TPA: 2'-5' RNA ligase family protein [Propionibacteriaceae bacterium]
MADLLRYGVFLRPDPITSLGVTTITGALRAQFGLVSAGAFPPHVTLVGSLPLAVPEDELAATLAATLVGWSGFEVQNRGVRPLSNAVVYDVHELDGAPNPGLIQLVTEVDAAVRPLLDPDAPGLAADLHRPDRWWGHLSLASHELDTRLDLHDEVLAFARDLDLSVPAEFRADTIDLYRFAHPTWDGSWWRAMTWEHVKSWRLPS